MFGIIVVANSFDLPVTGGEGEGEKERGRRRGGEGEGEKEEGVEQMIV